MNGVATILGRELRGYFNSVIAYIFIIVFLLVSCGLYMTTFFLQGSVDMRTFFGILPFVLLVFLPAISMRLWAEERSLKTDELLLTCPMPTWQFVVGKFLAAFLFFLIALAGTLTIPIMLAWLGDPDGGAIAAAYVGTVLFGAFLLALGLMISGFAREQIVAFVLSLSAGFLLFLQGTDVVTEQIDGWVPGLGTLMARALGLSQRLDEFARGVVPVEGVFFFLVWTGLFLMVNVYVMDRRGRSRAEGSFATGLGLSAAVTVLLVLVVSTLDTGRLDWTEDDLFTVSPATQEILGRLDDKVRVTYYVSPEDKMPTAMKRLGRDVRDKLEELAHASGDALEVSILDPTDPDVAKKAEEVGVQPFPLQSLEQDEFAVKLVYSSLVISYLDEDELVPQVHPGNFPNLEYEVVSRVFRLLQDEPAVVAFQGASEGVDPQMAAVYQQMGQPMPPPREIYGEAEALIREGGDHSIRKVDLASGYSIPVEARTLVVLEPRNLGEDARAEIARFLHEGGNVVTAIQPYLFEYLPTGAEGIQITPEPQSPAGLEELLSYYGVRVREGVLMDQENEILTVPTRARMGFLETYVDTPVKVPVQVHVVRDNVATSAPAVGQAGSLLYLWGTGFELDEETLASRGLEHEVLFTSTRNSWMSEPVGPLTPNDVDPAENELSGPIPLAVMVRGVFPEGPWGDTGDEASGEDASATTEGESEGTGSEPGSEGTLLVVGSARMFSDGLIRALDNALILLNAVDTLTLGPELVKIRGKNIRPRSYQSPSPAGKFWWRAFVVVLVPLLVAGIGLGRHVARRRARERYLQDLKARRAA